MDLHDQTRHLPASEAMKQQSLGRWRQTMARYPLGSRWSLGLHILMALGANGTIAWLIGTGRMTPFELVLLVALEAGLLIGIAWLQSRLVPPAAREINPMPLRERLGTFAFALLWLGGVYGIVLAAMVPSGDEARQLLRDPVDFLARSNLKWPLLITLAGALLDALQDAAHFRRAGGIFLSTPGFNGAARWMTLFLGGIPFFVPMVAVLISVKTVIENAARWLKHRRAAPDRNARLITLLLPMLILIFFGSMAWLLQTGVSAWAVGYSSAKLVAELFIVCLPLIASTAYAEEVAASKQVPEKRKRKK